MEGSASSLAQTGVPVVDMRVAGRWRLSEIPTHYAKNIAKVLTDSSKCYKRYGYY